MATTFETTMATNAAAAPFAATEGLDFELIEDFEALKGLEPEWRALLAECAQPEPMLDTPWLFEWFARYGAGRRLAIGVFRRDGALVGIAPMIARRFNHRPGIPFRRLELLGSGYDDPDGVFSEYLGLIARERDDERVARAFARALSEGAFGRFDECVLELVDGSAPKTAALRRALDEAGLPAAYHETTPSYYLSLPESWDAYLASVHGKRRNWFRRTMRDFEKWVGDRGYAMERATDAESLARGMEILEALHETRWSDAGQAGAFASERFKGFHHAYARVLLEAGRLELKWLVVGAEPVAIQYNFLGRDKVYFYQSGRIMDAPGNIRIGIVMHVLSIQEAMARGCAEFDFMGGDAEYKRRFTSTTRPLATIRVAPTSLVEVARRGAEGGIDALRAARDGARALKTRISDEVKARLERARASETRSEQASADGAGENTNKKASKKSREKSGH